MNAFNQQYAEYLSLFESYLNDYAKRIVTKPDVLGESMRYSLLNGGKRIRPVLMLAVADVLGVDATMVLPYALALEMIHTYSLIHDDLPAMDNDDFRRGKPSSHKAFGEANAILAGDALLNQAFTICFGECLKGEKQVLAAKFLSECAGMNGMIIGQSADLYYSMSQQDISQEQLAYIHENKTGKLLAAAILIPSILSGNQCYLRLEQFAQELGVLFQITDDILDVTGKFESLGKTIGKDEVEGKLTYVKLYGLDGAMIRCEECAQRACTVLESIVDSDVDFLFELVGFVKNRSR